MTRKSLSQIGTKVSCQNPPLLFSPKILRGKWGPGLGYLSANKDEEGAILGQWSLDLTLASFSSQLIPSSLFFSLPKYTDLTQPQSRPFGRAWGTGS